MGPRRSGLFRFYFVLSSTIRCCFTFSGVWSSFGGFSRFFRYLYMQVCFFCQRIPGATFGCSCLRVGKHQTKHLEGVGLRLLLLFVSLKVPCWVNKQTAHAGLVTEFCKRRGFLSRGGQEEPFCEIYIYIIG